MSTDTPITDRAFHQYNEDAQYATFRESIRAMERRLISEQRLRALAETAVTCCHSAMLGKVNPKHPAWGCVYAVQDAAKKGQP